MSDDRTIVRGRHARYPADTIAQIDGHLRGLRMWLARAVKAAGQAPPAIAPARRAIVDRAYTMYRYDCDVLLNARTMLVSLATIETECSHFEQTGRFLNDLQQSPT